MESSGKKMRKNEQAPTRKGPPTGRTEVNAGPKAEWETTVESQVPKLSPEDKIQLEARETMKAEILTLARDNPAEIARLLRNWLKIK